MKNSRQKLNLEKAAIQMDSRFDFQHMDYDIPMFWIPISKLSLCKGKITVASISIVMVCQSAVAWRDN
jgi:hypothetical protein